MVKNKSLALADRENQERGLGRHIEKARSHAKAGYQKAMPNKKSHRVLVWLIFIFLFVVISFQLLYPADKSLPRSKINGNPAGGKDYEVLAEELLKDFEKTKIEIITNEGGKKIFLLREAGAQLKTEELTIRLQEYPVWQRLLPFSILLKQPNIEEARVFFYSPVLEKFSTKINDELTKEPVNATFAIKNGKLVATDDKNGSEVTAEQIRKALTEARPRLGKSTKVMVRTKPKKAKIPSEQFTNVRRQAEAALARLPALSYQADTFVVTKNDVATWLELKQGKAKTPHLSFNKKAVMKYIAKLNGKVGVAAGTTTVDIVDGKERGRKVGKPGRAIDSVALLQDLEDFVIKANGSGNIVITTYSVTPKVVYSRRYTSSQAGLRAYLNDIGLSQNIRVSVQQIGGKGWSAGVRENEATVSASTYKLYVALMLFNKMDRGKTSWGDKMLDTTVSGCFDRMIIASTNQCSETWLASWGRGKVNDFIWSKGFSSGTSFTHPEASHTTVRDLTNYMVQLENGSLMAGRHRSRLLSGLSSHSYKNGIPAGSSATTIFNKVGFLWSYSNDTAIVRHPKGTYVISVMTSGSGFWKIAEITREVEKIMYP